MGSDTLLPKEGHCCFRLAYLQRFPFCLCEEQKRFGNSKCVRNVNANLKYSSSSCGSSGQSEKEDKWSEKRDLGYTLPSSQTSIKRGPTKITH